MEYSMLLTVKPGLSIVQSVQYDYLEIFVPEICHFIM